MEKNRGYLLFYLIISVHAFVMYQYRWHSPSSSDTRHGSVPTVASHRTLHYLAALRHGPVAKAHLQSLIMSLLYFICIPAIL